MKTARPAIVTGITGQDGSYLAERLLSEGVPVIGIVRDLAGGSGQVPASIPGSLEIAEWDMRDEGALRTLLVRSRPGSFYNMAAYARGSAMFDDPVSMGEVNGLAVVRVLEAIREIDPSIRFCQASSSEMYGDTEVSPCSETTPMRPSSPYAAAKAYAHAMVGVYRARHGLFASSAILFNHESPRRGTAYVTRKITQAVARIRLGLATELRLGSLDSRRDWGFAPDYVRAMSLMLAAEAPDDFVVATGEMHSVREFCAIAFRHVGLDYRDHVLEDPDLLRPGKYFERTGDAAKARHVLNWRPTVSFPEMVGLMVDHDLGLLSADRT